MDFSKPKPSYLSLKRTLETTKYKLKYSKTQEKNLTSNISFPATSKLPTRKPSEVTMKNMNPENISMERSTIYHYEAPVELSESFDTCFYSFSKSRFPGRPLQTEKNNVSCSKCGHKADEAMCQEIRVLKSEVMNLREALKEIQNTLNLERENRSLNKAENLDSEDRRSIGFNKLQEKIINIQKLYDF